MKREGVRVTILWLLLTALGEIAVFAWPMLPETYSREADVVDEAFMILMAFGIPVFAFVVAMVVYSIVRFRVKGDGPPTEDGPPIKTHRGVVKWWLIVTGALAATVLIWPGFTGIAQLRADEPPDLVVDVVAQRWFWTITYPNGGSTTAELVVPVDTNIRFDVTSLDILHSFWVPGFRTKIDAVPNRTTELSVTPLQTGTADSDSNLRVQCAELCGLGHGRMTIPVRVLSQSDFDEWADGLIEEGA